MELKTRLTRIVAASAIGGLLTVANAAGAQLTQFHPSFYGSAELDTRNSQFYLPGVYVGVGGLGWSPYFNANGYALRYQVLPQVSSSNQTLTAILPTLALS